MIKRTLLAALLAGSIGGIATPATAAPGVQYAPPASYDEPVPPSRNQHVWVGGHWQWRTDHHQWVKGAWLRERAGYRYHQPAWVQRDGLWHFDQGNWSRPGDRDGDGVSNRRDDAPFNPNRN